MWKQKYPDRQVVVGNSQTRQALDSRVFFNNPNISDPKKLDENKIVHFVDLNNTNRPYIDWQKTTVHKYCWNLNIVLYQESYTLINKKLMKRKM